MISVMRGTPLTIRGSLPVVAALVLAGCAMQATESAQELKQGIVEQSPTKGPEARTATPKPAEKTAATKKPGTSTTAAKAPPSLPATRQDETSCANVEKCVSVLKAMVADPNRSWIQRPATPAVLANGVRLFAYRALRPRLTCGELAAALTEIETAAHTFSGPIAGLQSEQTSRVRTLCVEVGDELQAENARRCAPGSKEGPVG